MADILSHLLESSANNRLKQIIKSSSLGASPDQGSLRSYNADLGSYVIDKPGGAVYANGLFSRQYEGVVNLRQGASEAWVDGM